MQQVLKPGQPVDFLTPDELYQAIARPRQLTRMRVPSSVQLDGTGSGTEEVFKVPIGQKFEARRVSINIPGLPSSGVLIGSGGALSQEIIIPAPGGNSWTQVVPAGQTWRLRSTFASYSANATVGTRFPAGMFVKDAAGNFVFQVLSVANIAANGNMSVSAITNGAGGVTALNTSSTIQLVTMPDMLLLPGWSFGSLVSGAVAGDTWSNIQIIYDIVSGAGGDSFVAYRRSGTLIEYGQPQFGGVYQVPGVQTWSREQGPYLQNGEVFEIQASGLTPNGQMVVTLEGILERPAEGNGRAHS